MQTKVLEGKTNCQFALDKVLFFEVTNLVAPSTAMFPLREFPHQVMAVSIIVWFVARSWMFNTPSQAG
jgi:hypothetical protein